MGNIVWVLEQQTIVGSDDYFRIGIYNEPMEILAENDQVFVTALREWANSSDLTVTVDTSAFVLRLESRSDRIELTPERVGPNTPENEMELTERHLIQLQSVMSRLMGRIIRSNEITVTSLSGSWKFVPNEDKF